MAGLAGVDTNAEIPCVLPDIPLLSQEELDDKNVIWIIDGSVYGLLRASSSRFHIRVQ